jgi:hypothetical protein
MVLTRSQTRGELVPYSSNLAMSTSALVPHDNDQRAVQIEQFFGHIAARTQHVAAETGEIRRNLTATQVRMQEHLQTLDTSQRRRSHQIQSALQDRIDEAFSTLQNEAHTAQEVASANAEHAEQRMHNLVNAAYADLMGRLSSLELSATACEGITAHIQATCDRLQVTMTEQIWRMVEARLTTDQTVAAEAEEIATREVQQADEEAKIEYMKELRLLEERTRRMLTNVQSDFQLELVRQADKASRFQSSVDRMQNYIDCEIQDRLRGLSIQLDAGREVDNRMSILEQEIVVEIRLQVQELSVRLDAAGNFDERLQTLTSEVRGEIRSQLQELSGRVGVAHDFGTRLEVLEAEIRGQFRIQLQELSSRVNAACAVGVNQRTLSHGINGEAHEQVEQFTGRLEAARDLSARLQAFKEELHSEVRDELQALSGGVDVGRDVVDKVQALKEELGAEVRGQLRELTGRVDAICDIDDRLLLLNEEIRSAFNNQLQQLSDRVDANHRDIGAQLQTFSKHLQQLSERVHANYRDQVHVSNQVAELSGRFSSVVSDTTSSDECSCNVEPLRLERIDRKHRQSATRSTGRPAGPKKPPTTRRRVVGDVVRRGW